MKLLLSRQRGLDAPAGAQRQFADLFRRAIADDRIFGVKTRIDGPLIVQLIRRHIGKTSAGLQRERCFSDRQRRFFFGEDSHLIQERNVAERLRTERHGTHAFVILSFAGVARIVPLDTEHRLVVDLAVTPRKFSHHFSRGVIGHTQIPNIAQVIVRGEFSQILPVFQSSGIGDTEGAGRHLLTGVLTGHRCIENVFQRRNPRLVEQPRTIKVDRQVPIVQLLAFSLRDIVRISLCSAARKVTAHLRIELKRRAVTVEGIGITHRKRSAVIRFLHRTDVLHRIGVVDRRIEETLVGPQRITFSQRHGLGIRHGLHPDFIGSAALLGLDDDRSGAHIAVFGRRNAADDLDRLDIVGRNGAHVDTPAGLLPESGRFSTHQHRAIIHNGSIDIDAHRTGVDAVRILTVRHRIRQITDADEIRSGVRQFRIRGQHARQQLHHVLDGGGLQVVHRLTVDRRRGVDAAAPLGRYGHGVELQARLLEAQRERPDRSADRHLVRKRLVTQAGCLDGVAAGGHRRHPEPAFGIGHHPQLKRRNGNHAARNRLLRVVLRHGPFDGDLLRSLGPHSQRNADARQ